MPVFLLQQLLLCAGVLAAAAAAVRRRVPGGKCCCRFIESDSIQCFPSLHSNTIFQNVCSHSKYGRIYGLDLPVLHPR